MEAYEGTTLHGALDRAEEYDTDGKCGIEEELISVHRFFIREASDLRVNFRLRILKDMEFARDCVKYISFLFRRI